MKAMKAMRRLGDEAIGRWGEWAMGLSCPEIGLQKK